MQGDVYDDTNVVDEQFLIGGDWFLREVLSTKTMFDKMQVDTRDEKKIDRAKGHRGRI